MQVVNIHRDPGEVTHIIMRSGPFGNPFRVGPNTREEAIDKFERYARGNPELMKLIEALPEDAVLGCVCKPKACHGDIIVKLWHEARARR